MASATDSSRRRLDSWKDVAEYLSRDVRTVMRWAQLDGLPVHHIGGSSHRAVFAWADEIDDWLAIQGSTARTGRRSPPSSDQAGGATAASAAVSPPKRAWLWLTLAAALVLAAAAGFGWIGRWGGSSPAVVKATMVGTTLVGFDAAGLEVWRYDASVPDRIVNVRQVRVADVDGDRRPDVVAMLSLVLPAGDGTGAMIVLDAGGHLLWKRTLSEHYTFGTVDYGPTWFPDDVVVFHTHGEVRLAAAWHHHTWWPSIVSTFDRDGRTIGRFVNAGWIHRLNVTADGRYLLAAGVSNAFGGAILAVLDVTKIDGAAPAAEGRLPPCSNCPSGSPRAYVLVPWSDVAQPSEQPSVTVQVADSGTIEFRAGQRNSPEAGFAELIVELSPSLEILHRQVSDTFIRLHHQLEREGVLTHPADQCPWRTPAVRIWTPELGWRELQ